MSLNKLDLPPVVVLVATTPRFTYLISQAIDSVVAQTVKAMAVVVVSDRRELTIEEVHILRNKLVDTPLVVLKNQFLAGVAGSWNSGIQYIAKNFCKSYIAILDDDDRWLPEHLQSCLKHSDNGTADIILSGINIIKNDNLIGTNIPRDVIVDDFLTGNPGWQGSNTFISVQTALSIDGYTNGMVSSNDRDFAIRCLSLPNVKVRYTNCATVNWRVGHTDSALSAAGSDQKLQGSVQFLQKYMHRMSAQQIDQYFTRMENLFNLDKARILISFRETS
jgi:glycosyltransferase involved in cell wall biosynthesis